MNKNIPIVRERDWSLNLEDSYYEEHPDEMMPESVEAVGQTKPGCYVNIVTPGKAGDPREGFISQLSSALKDENISVRDIQYIDQCGCGGYVVRVYR